MILTHELEKHYFTHPQNKNVEITYLPTSDKIQFYKEKLTQTNLCQIKKIHENNNLWVNTTRHL